MSGATRKFIHDKMQQWPVCVFSKRRDPDCLRAKEILTKYQQKMPFTTCEYIEIESRQDCEQIENYLQQLSLNDSRKVKKKNFFLLSCIFI